MYSAVLSVLLMGMLPALQGPQTSPFGASVLSVAAPSPVHVQTLATQLGDKVSASGVLVLDFASGQQVFGRHAREHRSIGSLTKLMTALIIEESHPLDEVVTIPREAAKVEGQAAHFTPGTHFTVGDLLSALLIPSDNDAAVALAIHHSGSVKEFVEEMNIRAKALGLQDTSYQNPAGLDSDDQWSTARDTAMLAAFVMRSPVLRERLSTREARIQSQEGQLFTLTHTHEMLQQDGSVIAGKTGTTPDAKQCLLSLVEEQGRQYLVVLLGSRERYDDMRSLLRTLDRLSAST